MKIIKQILLVILIILFCFIMCRHKQYLSVFYFENDTNKIALDVETTKDIGDVYACLDSDCIPLKNENNIYAFYSNFKNMFYFKRANQIKLLFKNKENIKYIKQIDLFIGNSFEKINNFEANHENINNSQYAVITVAQNIDNSKNLLQKFSIYFEALFHNIYLYTILFLIYLLTKPKFKTNHKICLFSIIILGVILRLSHIDTVPLWNDELYVFTVISPCGNAFALNNIFSDPGNPPLFFLISNIWLKFFHNSVFEIRLLPLLLGILLIYNIYYFSKKVFNTKVALTCAFLSSINLVLILQSNEIRSYILAMNLIIICSYFFYQLYRNFNKKNLILYTIFSILFINTHLYCVLVYAFNYIFGLFLFKDKIKFTLSNLIAFSFFGIYLLISYKDSLSKDFNTWLPKPSLLVFNNHITFYFGNIIFFAITIIFLIWAFKKFNETEKKVVVYSVSSIIGVFIFSLTFSLIVKPILFERYFIIFIPHLVLVTAILLNLEYKTKYKSVIIAIILFLSINMQNGEYFNLFSNIYALVKYSTSDYKNYENEYESFFIIPDNKKYVNYYREFDNIKKENVIVSKDGITEHLDTIDEYLKKLNKKKGKFIFYAPEICVNMTIINKYKPQKLDTSILPIYKFFVIK